MNVVLGDSKFPQIVRLNRKVASGYVLATYKVPDGQFVTYRNNNAIGWASIEVYALQLHEMYLEAHKGYYY
jgi:hypothetical protein